MRTWHLRVSERGSSGGQSFSTNVFYHGDIACSDDWAEQKYLEGLGRREVFDYGKPLPLERVVLSSIWGGFTVILFSRVFWQLIHGNRNLF